MFVSSAYAHGLLLSALALLSSPDSRVAEGSSVDRVPGMTAQERRDRERARRHRLIIDTARRIAEDEGWEAVTTRRLAADIEYSQPVLYSHFSGKAAIMAAVADDGFAELAAALSVAREPAGEDAVAALHAVADAYLRFAADHPALYEAMFPDRAAAGRDATGPTGRDALAALRTAVEPISAGRDAEPLTELFWSTLHGQVSLRRAGLASARRESAILPMIVSTFAASAGTGPSTPRLIAGGRISRGRPAIPIESPGRAEVTARVALRRERADETRPPASESVAGLG